MRHVSNLPKGEAVPPNASSVPPACAQKEF